VHASLRFAPDKSRDDLLPPLTPYFVMKVGHVPLIAYLRPGAPEVGEQVAEAIRQAAARGAPIRVVMLSRLGPNVWHETPAAGRWRCSRNARRRRRLWLGCEPPTGAAVAAQIDELRRHVRRPLVNIRGDRDARVRRQPEHDVRRASVSRALRRSRGRWLRGGRVPLPLRVAGRHPWPRR
jgi:hypothetical protein